MIYPLPNLPPGVKEKENSANIGKEYELQYSI
jgi:hypothetical protein